MKTLQKKLGYFSFALLSLVGCALDKKIIDMDSNPSGAVIYIDGERQGVTRHQVTIEFNSGQRVLVQVCKPQYKPVFQYWTYEETPTQKIFYLEAE